MLLELRGRSALDRLITRLRIARRPELLVLCTTTCAEDDELEAAARPLGLEVYRGERDDILVRWLGAADRYDIDFIVACDGDDVFCDPVFVDRVIERHEQTGADYVTCWGLPFGTAPTGVARTALRRVCELKRETDTAGQGRFFVDDRITRAEVRASEGVAHKTARLTLDYSEDVEFFEAVLAELDPLGDEVSLEQIVTLLRARPDLVEINGGLQEEYWRRFNSLYPPVELTSG
jgi:spore coat polysaccharide biosynthesis protein SpsF (cytidylyltransferase family)